MGDGFAVFISICRLGERNGYNNMTSDGSQLRMGEDPAEGRESPRREPRRGIEWDDFDVRRAGARAFLDFGMVRLC